MRKEEKASKRAGTSIQARTLSSVNILEAQLTSGFTQLTTKLDSLGDRMVDAIKSTSTSQPSSFNWTPVVQGLVSGVAQSFGASVNFPQQYVSPTMPTSTSPAPIALEDRITALESKFGNLDSALTQLTSSVTQLTNGQNQLITNMKKENLQK
jgi:uncharacterized coiled-coil protein SlyX